MRWGEEESERVRTKEQIRQVALDNTLASVSGCRDREEWAKVSARSRQSEYARALDAISLAALNYAEATNAPTSGPGDSFESYLERGFEVVNNLRWSLRPYDQKDDESNRLKLWSHRNQLPYDVKSKKTPHLSRPEIETATGEYLKLPYRADHIDRLFADLLIALELYQYFDQMINEEVIPFLGPPRSPLKRVHPFTIYLKARAMDVVFCAGLAAVVFGLHRYQFINDQWALGGYIASAVIFLLFLGLTTVYLPYWWRSHTKEVNDVTSLMADMLSCYSELRSHGPVSARRLLERLKEAANKGVAWPGPLWALLDDVMARSGRL
jgi:hypothetical protein